MVAPKIVRVVIDTNVLVSGLLFGGTPGELLPLWQSGRIKPSASREIIDEYMRVLTYPKLKLTEEEIQYLLYNEILPYFDVAAIGKSKKTITQQDPADDIFILCAQAAKATVIISGDQHLLALGSHRNINIFNPAEFLSALPC